MALGWSDADSLSAGVAQGRREIARVDNKTFVAVWALGYDYLPDVAMHAVFVLALLAGWLARKVRGLLARWAADGQGELM